MFLYNHIGIQYVLEFDWLGSHVLEESRKHDQLASNILGIMPRYPRELYLPKLTYGPKRGLEDSQETQIKRRRISFDELLSFDELIGQLPVMAISDDEAFLSNLANLPSASMDLLSLMAFFNPDSIQDHIFEEAFLK